jgi:hypothetical protein
MRGAIPPLLQCAFMSWCLVKHRDNFLHITALDAIYKCAEVVAVFRLIKRKTHGRNTSYTQSVNIELGVINSLITRDVPWLWCHLVVYYILSSGLWWITHRDLFASPSLHWLYKRTNCHASSVGNWFHMTTAILLKLHLTWNVWPVQTQKRTVMWSYWIRPIYRM